MASRSGGDAPTWPYVHRYSSSLPFFDDLTFFLGLASISCCDFIMASAIAAS